MKLNLVALTLLASGAAVAAAPARAQTFVGLGTGGTTITTFGSNGVTSTPAAITGLTAGETIIDIDYFTSGDGRLFGLGSQGRLYTLTVGGATSVATLNTGPVYTPDVAGGPTSVGTATAIDFNPMADRLRVFSGTSNFRITPTTGVLSNDGAMAYVAGDPRFGLAPNLVGAAYINNFDGAGTTALYSIDANSDSLVIHSVGPQFSTLSTQDELQVGGVGAVINFLSTNTGFDILTVGGVNTAYVSNGSTLYTVTLNSGMVGDPAGNLTLFTTATGAGAAITDFAVIPGPGTMVCAVVGSMSLLGRRRRA